jgi:hypothetical protein
LAAKKKRKSVRSWLCTKELWNPNLFNIFGAEARYRRAAICSSHDDAHPDNPTLHVAKIYSFSAAHLKSCSSPAARASRRRCKNLGATIKYLRKTTSGDAGIGLGTTIKYPAASDGLGTTLNYLRGAADNGRAQR